MRSKFLSMVGSFSALGNSRGGIGESLLLQRDNRDGFWLGEGVVVQENAGGGGSSWNGRRRMNVCI